VRIRILWVGKTQEEWVRRGIDEYAVRIGRYVPLEISEAREEKGVAGESVREKEGVRLAKLVPRNTRIILLDERGDEMTSPDFAGFLGRSRDGGVPELAFTIGGAYGFSDSFRQRAD
jgi:23S rRNA (pseudouridine1915-N3)-methyltransferase